MKQQDIKNINNAYLNKIEEYNKMTLEELKELFNTKRIGGTYKKALINVVNTKLQEQKDQTIKNNIEELKNE